MIIVISGKPYPMVDLHEFANELTFNQLMSFNRELAVSNISRCRTIGDVLELLAEVKSLPVGSLDDAANEPSLMNHPEGGFLLGVMIWAARTVAGERLTLLEACDIRMADLHFVSDSPATTGDAEGKASRGSGQGAGRRPRQQA